MRRADIEVPNPAVDGNSWAGLACYPRGSFCPLSHTPSTRECGITQPDFRPCSACLPRSQAPFCLCTPQVMSIHLEGTFGRLRYPLGGDRPSQTPHLALSAAGLHRLSMSPDNTPEWYFTGASTAPARAASSAPTYPPQVCPRHQARLESSSTGSFCPVVGNPHLHGYCNFAEPSVETAPRSFLLSCGSELTRQGISLP